MKVNGVLEQVRIVFKDCPGRSVHFGSNSERPMVRSFLGQTISFLEFSLRPAICFLGKKLKLTDLFICNNVVIKSGK